MIGVCSKVIGKIIKKEIGQYKAIAEGVEYTMYSCNDYNLEEFVVCCVLSHSDEETSNDESEFYLEDANAGRKMQEEI